MEGAAFGPSAAAGRVNDRRNIAYETPRLPRPDRRKMAIHAIHVLEAAMRDAWEAPILLTPAVELALDTLQDVGLALDHQTGRFVEGLTTDRAATGTVGEYMRHTSMEQMIFTWRSE